MMAELMCGSIKDTARPCSSTCVPASSSAVLAPYEWLATVVRPASRCAAYGPASSWSSAKPTSLTQAKVLSANLEHGQHYGAVQIIDPFKSDINLLERV